MLGRPHERLFAALIAASLFLAGCSPWISTGNAVYGPYPSAGEAALFERVVTAVRARGYRVLDADAEAGHFAVRSQAFDPRRGHTVFRFRLYRGGWIAVEPVGGGTRRTFDGQFLMSPAVHHEYASLVTNLLSSPEEERP